MYKTFDGAVNAAKRELEKVIIPDRAKLECCIREYLEVERRPHHRFTFEFHAKDTGGKFVRNEYGDLYRDTDFYSVTE